MSVSGKWRITQMDVWDQEDFELLGPAFFSFDGKRSGQFRFIAVEGRMDCRPGQRDGRPFVEFTWEGNDEGDPVSGRGWVALKPDGTLSGHIYFHHGDESGFTAIRTEDETKSHLKASPKTKRGGR